MDDNQFKQIVLEKLEKNDKFQSMALEYMAKLTQQLVEIQNGQRRLEGRMDSLESRMTKLELKVENEVVDKLKVVFEKVDGIDQRLSDSEKEIQTLKRVQ